MSQDIATSEEKVVKNVVCPFCGCLCDDIELFLEEDKIVSTINSCRISHAKFTHVHEHRITEPMIRRNGELVKISYEKAFKEAARILAEAKRPLSYGWSTITCETHKKAIELAEITRGCIDNTTSVCHGPSVLGIQSVGASTCTLGEVKNRADLVVYWGSNPISAHPRHISRYTLFPHGHFREKGRRERKFIVVDTRKTATANLADLFVRVEPSMDYEVISTLRAALHGLPIPDEGVGGVDKATFEKMITWMKGASFIALFFGMGLTMSPGKHRNIDIAISLITDLNAYTKAVLTPMRGHFNVAGFNRVASWQTGFPFALDFSHGYPRYFPGETTTVDLLGNREADAALIAGSDPVSHIPVEASKHLAKIPTIILATHWNATVDVASLIIPTATSGIEEAGTAYRMDTVPLLLKEVIPPPEGVKTNKEVVEGILAEAKLLLAEAA